MAVFGRTTECFFFSPEIATCCEWNLLSFWNITSYFLNWAVRNYTYNPLGMFFWKKNDSLNFVYHFVFAAIGCNHRTQFILYNLHLNIEIKKIEKTQFHSIILFIVFYQIGRLFHLRFFKAKAKRKKSTKNKVHSII